MYVRMYIAREFTAKSSKMSNKLITTTKLNSSVFFNHGHMDYNQLGFGPAGALDHYSPHIEDDCVGN